MIEIIFGVRLGVNGIHLIKHSVPRESADEKKIEWQRQQSKHLFVGILRNWTEHWHVHIKYYTQE